MVGEYKPKLSDLQARSYPEDVFEDKATILQPDDTKIVDKDSLVEGQFGDVRAVVRYDWRNAEVWAKCECGQYGAEPCEHIVSLFLNFAKHIPKSVEKTRPKSKTDVSQKIGEALKQRKEQKEQKEKAIDKFKRAEQLLAMKTDDLDEELAIKEFVEGTEPLVYRITWKDKRGQQRERLVLSLRGWTQAMLLQGNIEIVDVKFEEVGGKSIAKAIVRDTARNITQIGIAERYTNEEFKWTTLASKAIRNALKKVISPAYEQMVVKQAMDAQLVINLSLSDLREVAEP